MSAKKRRRLMMALATGALLAVSGCATSEASAGGGAGSGGSGSGQLTIRLGALESGVNQSILGVALAEHTFTKNGLNVQITPYESGSLGVDVQDLVSGREDIALDAVIDPVTYDSQAIVGGGQAPLKVIATAAPGSAVLVVKKSIDYQSVQDLKGLRIAVSNLTSSYIPLLTNYLADRHTSMAALGIKLEVVAAANQVPALTAGQIDGFIQSEPTGATAVKDGVGTYAIQKPADWGSAANVPITGVYASTKWLAANGKAARAFVKALQEASTDYRSGNADTMAPILASFTKSPEDVMRSAYGHFDPTLTPLSDAITSLFRVSVPPLVDKGTISPKVTAADVMDTSYGD
jgi:ABC-type nitrate/sulfonate/bicarbonate transport system substrate-binding protein